MSEDLARQVAVAAFRCCMLAVSNRDVLKSLVTTAYLTFFAGAISLIRFVISHAQDFQQETQQGNVQNHRPAHGRGLHRLLDL